MIVSKIGAVAGFSGTTATATGALVLAAGFGSIHSRPLAATVSVGLDITFCRTSLASGAETGSTKNA